MVSDYPYLFRYIYKKVTERKNKNEELLDDERNGNLKKMT